VVQQDHARAVLREGEKLVLRQMRMSATRQSGRGRRRT
jgi:hypothetical protein